MTDTTPSKELLLYLADTQLACGLQYGLWVERSPAVEEQISLSSMSQDKLGHARAYLQLLEEHHGLDALELQYDRAPGAFAWATGWTTALPTWQHLVVAQALFSRALLTDVRAFDPTSPGHDVVAKIEQEEAWHTRHGDAWLASLAEGGDRDTLAAAIEDLWPHAVTFLGVQESERFPEDLEAGVRTESDRTLRQAYLAEVHDLFDDVGLSLPLQREGQAWRSQPVPTDKLVAELEAEAAEAALELVALLQDPEGRELAEAT